MRKHKCNICCKEIGNLELVDHLERDHYLDYRTYFEISHQIDASQVCWKCGSPSQLLSTYNPKLTLPCWSCMGDSPTEITQVRSYFINQYSRFRNQIIDDRVLSYLLITGKINQSICHDLDQLSKLFSWIKDRDELFDIRTKFGSPPELSLRNVENIECSVRSTSLNFVLPRGKRSLEVLPNVFLEMADWVDYDVRHHARYNALNEKATRSVRKLRMVDIDATKCIKFHNTEERWVKTFFRLVNKDQEPVKLCKQDLTDLKLLIFRNKTMMKLVNGVINEFVKHINRIEDGIFLRNKIDIPINTTKVTLRLAWDQSDLFGIEDGVNIAII